MLIICAHALVFAAAPPSPLFEGGPSDEFMKWLEQRTPTGATPGLYVKAGIKAPVQLLHRSYLLGTLKRYTELCTERQMSADVPSHKVHVMVGITAFSGRGKSTAAVAAGGVATLDAPCEHLPFQSSTGVVARGSHSSEQSFVRDEEDFAAGYASEVLAAAPLLVPVLAPGVTCKGLAKDNFVFVYTTFNGSTSLSDAEMERGARSLDWCIAFRILRSHFAWKSKFKGFESEVEHAFDLSFIKDPIDFALCCIAKSVNRTVESPAVIMLIMDEFQRLDNSLPLSTSLTNTQKLYRLFSDVIKTCPKPYVFCPVFAGLVQQPLVTAAIQSSMRFVPLPLHSLTLAECNALADATLPPGWRQNSLLRRQLFQARAVPSFLVDIMSACREGRLCDDTLQRLVRDTCPVTQQLLPCFLRLFACVVLDATDYYNDRCGEDGLTLEEWEDRGGVYRAGDVLRIPHSLFVAVQQRFRRPDGLPYAELCLLECIHHLCKLDIDAFAPAADWAVLESLGALYTCMRINSLVLLNRDDDKPFMARFDELFPCAAASGSTSNLMICLRPVRLVQLSADQYIFSGNSVTKGSLNFNLMGRDVWLRDPVPRDISTGEFVFVAALNQQAVDVFVCFPDCYVTDSPKDKFSLFLFDQRKLQHSGSLTSVLKDGVSFCDRFAQSYSSSRGRVGWLYGIVNPIQRAGPALFSAMQAWPVRDLEAVSESAAAAPSVSVATAAAFEGAFCLDFESCPKYHGFMSEHPAASYNVIFVNDPMFVMSSQWQLLNLVFVDSSRKALSGSVEAVHRVVDHLKAGTVA